MLDLVDENDNVIGSVARSKANSDPSIFHREVAVLIYDKDQRLLLQKRALSKIIAPGIWTVGAAGHVDYGVTPETAAHNELHEELGFDTELKYTGKVLDKRENESRFIHLFEGKYPDGVVIKIDTEELSDAKFVAKDELEDFQKAGNEIGDFSLDQIKKYWSGC